MRQDTRIRIFPSYLDKSLTRAQGRRISTKLAIDSPKLIELKIAAQKLGYNVEVDQEKKYPRQWFTNTQGLLYLSKEGDKLPKNQLLKVISKTVTEYARPRIVEKQKELQKEREKTSKKGTGKKTPIDTRGKRKGQSRPSRRRR
jgi:signal recognition particle subunit SRP19